MVPDGLLRLSVRIDSQLWRPIPTAHPHLLHPIPLVREASALLQVSLILGPAQPHGPHSLPPPRHLPLRGQHLLPLGPHHNRQSQHPRLHNLHALPPHHRLLHQLAQQEEYQVRHEHRSQLALLQNHHAHPAIHLQ